MMNRFLMTSGEVQSLPLEGAALMQVRVAATYIDLIFEMKDSELAEVRVESRGTLTASGNSRTVEAGPALGSEVISLLEAQVEHVRADGLDLVLMFDQDRVLAVLVDPSGYVSYSVNIGGDTWVAISSSGDK